MKQQNDQETARTLRLPLWTYGRVVKALPYFRVLVGSLREHWLTRQGARRDLARLDARPGRSGIRELIERAEASRQADLAESELKATLCELQSLGGYCRHPGKGLALIPFRLEGALAWFVFDLYEPTGICAWRFHTDPAATRRPLHPIE
jgi:hypothetical protein